MDIKLFENDIKIKKLYELTFNNENIDNLKTYDMFNKINNYYKSNNQLDKLSYIYKNNKIITDRFHPSFSSDNATNYLNLNRSIQENQIKIIPIIDLSPDYTNIKNVNFSLNSDEQPFYTINLKNSELPIKSNYNCTNTNTNNSVSNEQITQLINENQLLQKKLDEIQNQINTIPDKISNIISKTNEIKSTNIYNHHHLNNDIIINSTPNTLHNTLHNTTNTLHNTTNNIVNKIKPITEETNEIKLLPEQINKLNNLFKLLFDNQILNYIEINNIRKQLLSGIINYQTVNDYLESKKKYIKLIEINNDFKTIETNKNNILNHNLIKSNLIEPRPTFGNIRQNNIQYPSLTDF
jgi:hypothetical protein